MLSIWEKESFISYDIIIVGAGISGLSTAASLIEKQPHLNILVLEKGLLPTGASTKNAGFACFGSISELSQDRKVLGDAGMLELVEKRWKGLQKTVSRLGEEKIGLEKKGGFELIDHTSTHYLEEIDSTNQLLKSIFASNTFSLTDKKIKEFGFDQTEHIIYNRYEGQLHTGRLLRSLWDYCTEKGVKIITGAEVKSYEENSDAVTVKTETLNFQCQTLAICTNAFSKALIKNSSQIIPGRGLVLLINPKQSVSFQGTFHFKEGYYYFRDFGQKIIFGGGRNLDFEGETTTSFGINEKILTHLHKYLKDTIIPNQKYETEMTWSGIMAFGESKEPIVTKLSDRIFAGVRLGGMGVAIGSMVGEDLANQILHLSR